jgi:hypothetical protein
LIESTIDVAYFHAFQLLQLVVCQTLIY